jgi:thioredoxin reductase (NADPH)
VNLGREMQNTAKDIENVVIIGSGPAGYTAALYTSRADLEPLLIEGFQWGGLLQQTTDVENYPGYPEGVMGPEMMQQFRDQAERFGTRFITDDATRVEFSKEGGLHRVYVGDREILAKTVILAMGAEPKKLGVPGEDALAARGVSYCATCDAAFFRDKPTIVVGGGDTAMEDATFLSKFASKVGIVHRRPEFRASAIMLDRAKAIDNIELITPYVVQRFEADGDGSLAKAVLRNREDGSTRELDIEGAFVAIGHRPNSELVKGQVMLDENGYVMTGGAAFVAQTPAEHRSTRTSAPGVFAAGDLVDHTYRQAVTAAGSGCMAALDAEWYLRDTPPDPEAHWAATTSSAEAAAS